MLTRIKNSTTKVTLSLTTLCILAAPIHAREFTNKAGKTINAEIEAVKDDTVTLKLKTTNKSYNLKINTLSQEDQDYIRNWSPNTPSKKTPSPKKTKKSSKKDKINSTDKTSPLSNNKLSSSYKVLKEKYDLQDNFDADWPKITSTPIPEITIVKEDKESKEFIYESPNYQFTCDVRLTKNVVKKFSHLFESTRDYCKSLPLSLLRPQLPEGIKKYKIILTETQESYTENGGPPGSSGVYFSGRDIILIPLTSIGVKPFASGYTYDYDGSNKTLPHEISHQLTQREYFKLGARGWFSEGLAEYIAMTDYRGGKFKVRGNDKDIKEAVTGFTKKTNRGRNLGTEFSAPSLEYFMNQPYSSFTQISGNLNYGLSALIVYYFLHMEEDDSRENINAFLKALNEGKQGQEAIDILLNGRSYNELEESIHKAWRSKGVKINFQENPAERE